MEIHILLMWAGLSTWQYTPTKPRYSHRSSKVASSDESAIILPQHHSLIMVAIVMVMVMMVDDYIDSGGDGGDCDDDDDGGGEMADNVIMCQHDFALLTTRHLLDAIVFFSLPHGLLS